MSKEYVCNSCNEITKHPHDVKMKEFYIGCSFEVDGVYPSLDKRKVKIHLCDKCFLGLKKIAEKSVTFATDNNVGGKWISVKDRLPEEECRCLVIDAAGDIEMDCYDGKGRFVLDRSGAVQHPSHWMPLPKMPEPPKGE